MNKINIAVIGGGASGLFYAMTAADLLKKEKINAEITVFEKENRICRKLLATGNGKCNISNMNLSGAFYGGSFAKNMDALLEVYNSENIMGRFKRYGLYCTPDGEGRVYPYSRQASAVLDCMLIKSDMEDVVHVESGTTVKEVRQNEVGYTVCTQNGEYSADYIVIACGGKAAPSLGSDGSGFEILSSLGVKINKPFPSLCPVFVADKRLKNLKGIRCKCSAALVADNEEIKREYGELQITENALSGICIFQLSRYVNEFFALGTAAGKRVKSVYIDIDLFPEMTENELFNLLKWRRDNLKQISIEQFFTGLVNKKLGLAVYLDCGLNHRADESAKSLSDNDIKVIAEKLKRSRFKPSAPSRWENAQVTAGGVSAEELDGNTLELKNHRGVYCIGECVDLDGLCGGYNLHWAWTSALICAGGTVRAIKKRANGGA